MQFFHGAAIRAATLSDLHFGKKSRTFGPDILERRLNAWADNLGHFRERGTDLHVFLLGDVNDGTAIYATQEHHQALTDVRAQAHDCADLLARVHNRLCQDWHTVTWHCVPGNHGRASKFAHEAANWDIQTYDTLSLLIPGGRERVDFYAPDSGEGVFIKRVRLGGHCYLLYHGMTIKSYQSIPWYGIAQRGLRWYSVEGFSALFVGHFHSTGQERLNRFDLLRTGSPADGDDWALESFGYLGDSYAWTFSVGDREAVEYLTRVKVG